MSNSGAKWLSTVRASQLFHNKVTSKGVPAHVMKAFKESRGTALLILNISGR